MDNGYLTADGLLALCGKRRFEDVNVRDPFSDGVLKFRIRSLFESEWSEISSGNLDLTRGGLDAKGIRTTDAKLVAASLVTPDGNLLLTGADAVAKIQSLGAGIVEPLVRACRGINNLRSVEDESKNSAGDSGSDTGSPDLRVTPPAAS